MSKSKIIRKEYAEMLKDRAGKGFIEKTDALDKLIDLMEHGNGDIKMGTSGCGSCFRPNTAIIIKKNEDKFKGNVSNAIKERVLELCSDYGITTNHLSAISGVSSSALYSIINGHATNIGILTICKIAEALNMTLEDFFCGRHFENFFTT